MNQTKTSKLHNEQLFRKRVEDILFNPTDYWRQLETYLESSYGFKYVRAVHSLDTAFDLITDYLPVKFPDIKNVILPAFDAGLFTNKLLKKHINPLFCDIDDHFCLDPVGFNQRKDFAPAVFIETKFGNLFNQEHIHGLYSIVYDSLNICAVDDYDNWTFNIGDIQVFSFDPMDMAGAFGGAIIATSDPLLASFIDLSNFYTCMSELQAAAILTQVENIGEIQDQHYQGWKQYIKDLPEWIIPINPNAEFSNFHMTPCLVNPDIMMGLGLYLHNKGILLNFGFKSIHHVSEQFKNLNLPLTDQVCQSLIALPNNADIKYVIDCIKEFK